MTALGEETDKKLAAVLTEEQMAQYVKLEQRHVESMRRYEEIRSKRQAAKQSEQAEPKSKR